MQASLKKPVERTEGRRHGTLRGVDLVALLLGTLVAGAGVCQPASAPAKSAREFHARIATVYGFQPHALNKVQMAAKSEELDGWWTYVKANAVEALPLLRVELSDASNPTYFSYDGAKLLLSLSESHADQALALQSMARVDLQDIDESDYLTTIQGFAAQGFDTREAAFRVLGDPQFKANISQHVLTLGQNYCLIYMLYPMPEPKFERDLIAHLDQRLDPTSQKSLLLALWYTMSPASRAALRAYGDNPKAPKEVASYAHELLARKTGVAASTLSVTELRRQRRATMQRPISDEALSDFDSLTVQLLAAQ